ncbi:MAG: M28 family peptidase, partial [Gemmatimonadales bacterium]
ATGILITGAEEFGLAGARIFARLDTTTSRAAVAVNLDTIDDEGALYLVSHDRPGTALARLEASRLSLAGLSPHTHRLPLGILVDSLPLARAGIPSITIGRLTWRTLRLIHTPRDTAEGLTLAMAREIGRALAVN